MMKKLFLFYLLLQLLVLAPDVCAAKVLTGFPAKNVIIWPGSNGNTISTAEFVKLNAKEFQKLTGRKLSFIQRIVFRAIQNKLRRYPGKGALINPQKLDEGKNNTFRFDIGGFSLGLLLSLPGLVIAAIMDRKKKPKNIFKSALIGFIIGTAFMFAFVFGLASTL